MSYPNEYSTENAMRVQDESNLNALAICSYIYGGLLFISALAGIFYIFLGGFMMSHPEMQNTGNPVDALGGQMMIGMGIGLIVIGSLAGILTIIAGKNLKTHRGQTLITVMAILHCFNIPLGTLLGVFTLVVLNKPSVKLLFSETTLKSQL